MVARADAGVGVGRAAAVLPHVVWSAHAFPAPTLAAAGATTGHAIVPAKPPNAVTLKKKTMHR